MKYICTEDSEGTKEIFVFPNSVNHDCMAEALQGIKNQTHGNWRRVYRAPISAGFTDGQTCFGESETLGLISEESDTELLSKQ